MTNVTATSVDVTYTPQSNFNGLDSFVFKVVDGPGSAATGTVAVAVTAVNDPPVAQAKSAAAQANMKLVRLNAGLLNGVTDVDTGVGNCFPVFTVASITAFSGGTVSSVDLAAGTFDFEPNPGFVGSATVRYTVADNGCPGAATSALANIVITVGSPVIWFVDTSAAAGNGTLSSPFNTLAAATTAMGANTNQRIFVYSGSTASGSGVSLPASSWLVGQGTTGASFDAVMEIAPPPDTIPRPPIAGAAPIIQGTVSIAGSSTRVRGLRIEPPAGSPGLVASLSGPFTELVVADVPAITTTNATAIDLNNVSGALSITAVNANNPVIGINLTNVSSSSGSFAITGNGGACTATTSACTGGTISGATDTGVKLSNANNVSLNRLRINGSGNFGLNGSSVSVLDLDSCLFDGAHGNALNEGSLFVTNWLTSGTISNSEILGGADDNVRVRNTTGTLNRLTISNTTVRDNSIGVNGNDGLSFATDVPSGTGAGVAMNLTVTNSTFRNHRNRHLDTGVTGLTTMDLVLANNTFTRTNALADTLADAVSITGDHQADLTFDVNGNTITGLKLSAFSFFQSGLTTADASMIGRFRNNVIGTSGVVGSGSADQDGLAVTSTGLATLTMNVTGNQIRQFANVGIDFSAGDTSPRVDVTITGNLVKEGNGALVLNAILFVMGTTSTGAVTACGDIGGSAPSLFNDVAGSVPLGSSEIRVRQRFSSTVRLPGLTGQVDAFLAGRNTVSSTSAVTSTGMFSGGLPCAQAP